MRGQRVAIASAALGIAVLGTTGFLFRDRALEEWYRRRLATASESERVAVIGKLEELGGERTLRSLLELQVRQGPETILHGDDIKYVWDHTLRIPIGARPDAEVRRLIVAIQSACRNIGKRIGRERLCRWYTNAVEDPSLPLRLRVCLGQQILLYFLNPPMLPASLASVRITGVYQPEVIYFELPSALPAVLDALSLALASDDELCRLGAAYALSWCGPEARAAIPALERAAKDPSAEVSAAATIALEQIRSHPDGAMLRTSKPTDSSASPVERPPL